MSLTLPSVKLFPNQIDVHSLLNGRTQRLPAHAYPLKLLGVPDAMGQYGLDVSLGFSDEEPNLDEMSVTINFADGNGRDGVGDVLEIGGIDTSRHRKNPIVLFDHGKEIKLPVALAENPNTREYTVILDPISKVGKAKAFFYRGNGTLNGVNKSTEYDHSLFCEQLFDLICKKYIRAGSIGYQIKSADHLPPYEKDEKGNPVGLHLLNVLMLECSAVVLPANQDTTRKALSMPKVCGKPMSPVLYKSLSSSISHETKKQIGWNEKSLLTKKELEEAAFEPFADLMKNADEKKRTHESPDYGYLYIKNKGKNGGSVWYVTADGDSEEFAQWIKSELKKIVGENKVTVEAESLPDENEWEKIHSGLTKNLPNNTTTQIAIPHGDLSKTEIPPPKMKPGWVDLKTFLDKLSRTTESFSDIEGLGNWMNRIFANPIDRHVYWVGEVGSKQLNEIKRRLKLIGVAKFSKSLSVYPHGDGWKAWNVKGSYFANCPRDATGHCLPQQEEGERKKEDKKNPPKAGRPLPSPKADGSSSQRGGSQITPAPTTREEVYAKGKWGMIVREGVVVKCGDPSIQIGQRVTEQWLQKNGWQRVEPTAVSGARTGEKAMATATGKKNIMPKQKQIPPQAPPTKKTVEKPMSADPTMDAPINPDVDVTELEAQDGIEPADPVAEPYGAGLLRQLYNDHKILMEDYHKLMAELDNPQIYRYMEKIMMGFEKGMSQMEGLFEQAYGDRGLKGISELEMDQALSEDIAADQMGNEADTLATDAIATDNLADEAVANQVPPPDVSPSPDAMGDSVPDEVNDPMGDNIGQPTDSDPISRPEAEDVADNMKRPDIKGYKGIKSIRGYWRQKAMQACAKCGAVGCKCNTKDLDGEEKRIGNAPGINPPAGVRTNQRGGPAQKIELSEVDQLSPPHTPRLGGSAGRMGNDRIAPQRAKPTDSGYYSDNKSADTFSESGEEGHKDLDARELKWIENTVKFLDDLADETKSFDESTRLECKGWHKLMNEVGDNDMSAHWRKPKKKEITGDLEWLNEEANESEHKMQADEEQEMTDMNIKTGTIPINYGYSPPDADGLYEPVELTVPDDTAYSMEKPENRQTLSEASTENNYKNDPTRSLCKDASLFLDAMSREKAFGSNHRSYAAQMAKSLRDAVATKAVPDQSKEPTPVDEQVQLAELSGVDEMIDENLGEKSLSAIQYGEIERLTKQVELLNSCF